MRLFTLMLAGVVLAGFAMTARAAEGQSLIDVTAPGAQKRLEPSSPQVTVTRTNEGGAPRLAVSIAPGDDGYPGVTLKPVNAASWNLSKFGHVEARITNMGNEDLTVSLRIDNAGDWRTNPWNGENLFLRPGATGTAKVHFGYSWGKAGFALKPEAVTQVLLFTGKTDQPRSFRIESIAAGGEPGERPADARAPQSVKPAEGHLFGQGTTNTIDASHARTDRSDAGLTVTFSGSSAEPMVWIKPEAGRWDLRDKLNVLVGFRNAGSTPITPRARLESDRGPSDWVQSDRPLAPGEQGVIMIPFMSRELWNGEKNSGTEFASDVASAVTISVDPTSAHGTLVVESARADVPPLPQLPDWLGQRPPVPGDWMMTFHDDFDGSQIDESKWNIYTENYWDKRSHFSRENVILGDGVVKLRFAKKTGHHNDDPSRDLTDYATGFLDSYGKWTQRYGYFEARMKLPTAPGLWPAFWMMPDRGEHVGPQWMRASTEDGGMEFDILEYLSRWGPYRYNIAMHWDGYGEKHQAIGTERIYVQPDADGFITAGALWTPGSIIYYANGQEVARWTNERVATVPMYPIFTAVSGGWDNSPLDDTQLPDDVVIDYIRCWQRADLAVSND